MAYPEHEKLQQRKDEHQSICEFLEWLENNGHIIQHYQKEHRCEWTDNKLPIRSKPAKLIADFFGINQQAFAEEKDKMIKSLIAAQAGA